MHCIYVNVFCINQCAPLESSELSVRFPLHTSSVSPNTIGIVCTFSYQTWRAMFVGKKLCVVMHSQQYFIVLWFIGHLCGHLGPVNKQADNNKLGGKYRLWADCKHATSRIGGGRSSNWAIMSVTKATTTKYTFHRPHTHTHRAFACSAGGL